MCSARGLYSQEPKPNHSSSPCCQHVAARNLLPVGPRTLHLKPQSAVSSFRISRPLSSTPTAADNDLIGIFRSVNPGGPNPCASLAGRTCPPQVESRTRIAQVRLSSMKYP